MKHQEYSIYIRAPFNKDTCHFGIDCPWACKNDGSFALEIMDDRNNRLVTYANICDAHLLRVLIGQVLE
jgi:hypothetical protein